jgi:hypothetical protein
MKESLSKRFFAIIKRWRNPPAQLSLLPPAEKPEAKSTTAQINERIRAGNFPGNFMEFNFFIELKLGDSVHIGYPSVPIRNMMTRLVRWGSRPEWSWPDPSKARIPWMMMSSEVSQNERWQTSKMHWVRKA